MIRDGEPLDITIVVPCRNEASFIDRFLRSLAEQELSGYTWEAIIADGGSDDGTRELIARHARDLPLRIIDNPRRIVSTGFNEAVRQARGRIIVRMDFHTEYARDYVARCVETLERTGAQNVGGPARTRARGFVGRAIAAAYHSPFACGGAKFHNESYEGWVDTVPYGCWKRSTLETLGLFDESLVRNQDDELNLRIIRSGGRIWQNPRIVSWYYPRGSLWLLCRQYFQYGFWKIPVIRKHRIPASWRHMAPALFIAAVGGLPLAALIVSRWFAALWLALVGLYAAACLSASVLAARRSSWALLPVLPAVFAVYHFSYGAGFLAGVLHWFGKRAPGGATGALFGELSR